MEFNYSIVERLRDIPWFENCEGGKAVSKYDISYAKDIDRVKKHCSSIRWDNIRLARREDVTEYMAVKRIAERRLWNPFAIKLKEDIMPDFKVYVKEKWEKKFEWTDEIKKTVCKDISYSIMIYQFRDFYVEPFYDEIISIYEQGYLPCGWKGTYPNGKIIIF